MEVKYIIVGNEWERSLAIKAGGGWDDDIEFSSPWENRVGTKYSIGRWMGILRG